MDKQEKNITQRRKEKKDGGNISPPFLYDRMVQNHFIDGYFNSTESTKI